MQNNSYRFVIFAAAIALIPSCGIPTSIPILPKKVEIKVGASVTVPLGKLNYSLYSGLGEGRGSLNDIMGVDWLEDLEKQGISVYDYRPAGVTDDDIQKFLVHYQLDMEDTMGGLGEIELSEYQDMINKLTEAPTEIDPVLFKIPEVKVEDGINVQIPLDSVVGALDANTGSLGSYTAFLPVGEKAQYNFPEDISTLPLNAGSDFSVTLRDMEALTFAEGKLKFNFTLTYYDQLPSGSQLELSDFRLREHRDSPPFATPCAPLKPGATGNDTVKLTSNGGTGSASIDLTGATLPKKFDLICTLKIISAGQGFFQLNVEPMFDDFTISGVKDLVLTSTQVASLRHTLDSVNKIDENDSLGDSFKAVIETGGLQIDTSELFPSIDTAGKDEEGWDLHLDMRALYIRQGNAPKSGIAGLSMGGLNQPPVEYVNDLKGKILNNQDVKIGGEVKAIVPQAQNGKDYKLTFQNFLIKNGATDLSYEGKVKVNLEVELFSTVTVQPEDFGLNGDIIYKEIEQDLGEDFTAFLPWLNYIQFPENGLGLMLSIEKLNIMDGLGLYVHAAEFGLEEQDKNGKKRGVFQPLVKDEGKESAELFFTSKNSGGYTLTGEALPKNGEPLIITVELGLENETDQEYYKKTGNLILRNVVPGESIELDGAEANLVFDWDKMSIRPQENKGENDSLPDYPFTGTFPDMSKGDEGMDMSDLLPSGLRFYIPEEEVMKGQVLGEGSPGTSGEGPAQGIDAHLYIGLKRQTYDEEQDAWVDEPGDDPDGADYDVNDPNGWRRNLGVNLPSLDFHIRRSDIPGNVSENLFAYNPNVEKGIGEWALSGSLNLGEDGLNYVVAKEDGKPFDIYTGPSVPEPDKAISLGNFAKVFNDDVLGEKGVFFEYTVKLSALPEDAKKVNETPGEILLYPEMLKDPDMRKKKIVASMDLLMIIPMRFKVAQTYPDVPVSVAFDPGLGNADLFGRQDEYDDGYFEMLTSLGFDINITNMAGLKAGEFYMVNKTIGSEEPLELGPIISFSNPKTKFSLTGDLVEEIKGVWPFTPLVSIRFHDGDVLAIEREFKIDLQSVAVRVEGAYTFETGL